MHLLEPPQILLFISHKKLIQVIFHKSILKQLQNNLHFISEKFCAFDYGEKNKRIYGRKSPPEYDLRKVTTPIAVYWSDSDWLTHTKVIFIVFGEFPIEIETKISKTITYSLFGIRSEIHPLYDCIISTLKAIS